MPMQKNCTRGQSMLRISRRLPEKSPQRIISAAALRRLCRRFRMRSDRFSITSKKAESTPGGTIQIPVVMVKYIMSGRKDVEVSKVWTLSRSLRSRKS